MPKVSTFSTEDLLPFFKDHTLKKHLKYFRKWQKLRSSYLTELTKVTDHQLRRVRAFDLENYVHAMFPTEQYSFATLMHKDFVKEVARNLIQAFNQEDS